MKTFRNIVLLCIGYPIVSFIGFFMLGLIFHSFAWLFIPDKSLEKFIVLTTDSIGSTTKIWAAAMFVSAVGFILKCCFEKRDRVSQKDTPKEKPQVKLKRLRCIAFLKIEILKNIKNMDKSIIAAIIVAIAIVALGFLTRPCEYRYQWIGKEHPVFFRLGGVFDKKLGRIYTFDSNCLMVDYPNHKITKQRKVDSEELPNLTGKLVEVIDESKPIEITDDPSDIVNLDKESDLPDLSDEAKK